MFHEKPNTKSTITSELVIDFDYLRFFVKLPQVHQIKKTFFYARVSMNSKPKTTNNKCANANEITVQLVSWRNSENAA